MTSAVTLKSSIELLKQLVTINTGSYNIDGINSCINLLISSFSRFNCSHEKITSADHKSQERCTAIVFSKNPDAKHRCLLSIHLDTVFDYDSSFRSFTLMPNNQATGPGVIDAKGGIVVLYNTLALLEASDLSNTLGWTVVISTDEEIGSPYSKQLLSRLAPKHNFALVFEPALDNGDIINQRPASANITLHSHGKAAHAGRGVQSGNNAIVHLLDFIQAIKASTPLQSSEHTINIGTITGGSRENVIPDLASACLNARFFSDDRLQCFLDQCKAIAQHLTKTTSANLSVIISSLRPAKPITPMATQLHECLLEASQELNLDIAIKASFGVSDANFIAAAGIPVLDTIGAVGYAMHTHNETIQLESLVSRSQLAFLCIKKMISKYRI